jgi:glycerol uptake facilitator-like aquaporin
VTIGLWSIKKIQGHLAVKYIAAQLLAAMLALFLTEWMGMNLGMQGPESAVSYFFEFFGMVLFTFGIASIVTDSGRALISGLVIGGSLLLGISVSVLGGAEGLLNPAVALSLMVTNPFYYIAQIIGGVVGVQLYTFLHGRKNLPI